MLCSFIAPVRSAHAYPRYGPDEVFIHDPMLTVNNMSSYLQTVALDYLSIDELQIYILLFADDTVVVLFSYTKPGLQILLNKLHS